MLPPKALAPLLIIVLNLLTIHADTTDVCSGTASCPSKPILESLCDDHEVPSEVASGMMKLFSASKSATSTGRDEDGARDADVDVAWTADVKAMVRIIGLGQLEELRQPEAVDRFEYRWREVVGDWGDVVDVKALAVSLPIIFFVTKASPGYAIGTATTSLRRRSIEEADMTGQLPPDSTTSIHSLKPYTPHLTFPRTHPAFSTGRAIQRPVLDTDTVEAGRYGAVLGGSVQRGGQQGAGQAGGKVCEGGEGQDGRVVVSETQWVVHRTWTM